MQDFRGVIGWLMVAVGTWWAIDGTHEHRVDTAYMGGILLVVGAVVAMRFHKAQRSATLANELRTLEHHLERGELGAALDVLARLNDTKLQRGVQRVVDAGFIILAVRRGALNEAVTLIERRLSALESDANPDATPLRALRSMLRAAMNDDAGTRDDVNAVHADDSADAISRARAALAIAILIARAGSYAELPAYLTDHALTLNALEDRRERALLLALCRLDPKSITSVYRKPAHATSPGSGLVMTEWVAQFVPAAAERVPVGIRNISDLADPVVTPEGRAAVDSARRRLKQSKPARIGVITRVLAILCLVILPFWFATASSSVRHHSTGGMSREEIATISRMSFFMILGGAIIMTWTRRRSVKQAENLTVALSHDASPERERALIALTTNYFPDVGASACIALSMLSENRGAFDASLTYCDIGFARLLRHASRNNTVQEQIHTLIAARAIALTVHKRYDEADAELAMLPRSYSGRQMAICRTRIIRAAHTLFLEEIQDLAPALVDSTLPYHDALLLDIIYALRQQHSGELTLLHTALTGSRDATQWFNIVAPQICSVLATAINTDKERTADP